MAPYRTVMLLLPLLVGAAPQTRTTAGKIPATRPVAPVERFYPIIVTPSGDAEHLGAPAFFDRFSIGEKWVNSTYFIGGGCTPGRFDHVLACKIERKGRQVHFVLRAENPSHDQIEWQGTADGEKIEGTMVRTTAGERVTREQVEQDLDRIWKTEFAPKVWYLNGQAQNAAELRAMYEERARLYYHGLLPRGRQLTYTFKSWVPVVTVKGPLPPSPGNLVNLPMPDLPPPEPQRLSAPLPPGPVPRR